MMKNFDFSRPMPFRRVRASTYARDGSNADEVTLKPGETWAAIFEGAGEVLHLWFSCQPEAEGPYLSQIRLLAWFDGSAVPQVNVPLGDFFGMGHQRINDVTNAAFDVSRSRLSPPGEHALGYGCFNFWLPMPFAKGARFEFRNENPHPLSFAAYIDAAQYPDALAVGPYRFNATYREQKTTPVIPAFDGDEMLNTTGEDNYVILDVPNGEGTYLGCVMSVLSDTQTQGIWTEGDDMVFIDGLSWPPVLHGTSTEAYFNMAGGVTEDYQALYHGVSHFEPNGTRHHDGKFSVYRLHLRDPIPFKRSIRATIEHGHGNDCSAYYRSVAYWYGTGGDPVAPAVSADPKAMFGNPGKP